MSLLVLQNPGLIICRIFLNWDLSDVILLIDRVAGLGKVVGVRYQSISLYFVEDIYHKASLMMLILLGSVYDIIHHKVTLLYIPHCFILYSLWTAFSCLNSIRPISRLAEIKGCPDKSLKADKETNSLRLFCFGLNYFPGSRAMKNWQSFLPFEIKEEWLWSGSCKAAYLHRNGSYWLEWLMSPHFYRALGGSTWIYSALIVGSGTAFLFKVNCIRDNLIWGDSVCTSQSLLTWGLRRSPLAGGNVGATTALGIQGFSVASIIEYEALFHSSLDHRPHL